MLRLPISQARPGMHLAVPVRHPARPELILLRTGFRLGSVEIAKLSEMGCHEIWIRFPGLEFLAQFISPEVQQAHAQAVGLVAEVFDRAVERLDPELHYVHYKSAVAALLEEIARDSTSQAFMHELIASSAGMLSTSANVCMHALLMGLKLDFYLERERARLAASHARDTTPLGVGALFHDIGMLRLPPDVIERHMNRGNGCENDINWRKHVLLGYGLVQGEFDPGAAAIVLHHHQRFDGSGFPGRVYGDLEGPGLSGSEIHIFARIVFAATLFDALRFGGNGPPRPVVRVLGALRQPPYVSWIDPVVLKGLFAVTPAFSPGSIVRLTDGRDAVVVRWFPLDPCRPEVQILERMEEDPLRADLRTERIDLRSAPELRIGWADGVSVANDVFEPSGSLEFDIAALSRSMSNRADELEARSEARKAG
ncbi:MAG: HD domain-containing protein [Phycisphaeraceae bacterium]|nr:HD domain-containing protein [Phycisphaeraceae bacterium]